MPKQSEYEKLQAMLEVYEKILHPEFFMVFKKQLNAVYEENKRDAYKAAKISEEALQIEQMLNTMRASISFHQNQPVTKSFLIKCFYKDLIKLLNESNTLNSY